MRKRREHRRVSLSLVATICLLSAAQAQQSTAEQILQLSGIKGGLVVHIGCGDGRLTAALRANDSYMVHGLDRNAENIHKAHDYIQSLGIYGNVSVSQYDGKHLPYVDNLVNLVVAQQGDEVSREEILRVLAPNGVACIKRGDDWAKIVKQRPKEMDEWTHYMHDSTGNAVARDTLVGPPANLQWVGSPRWTRHHEHMSSINVLVSANGRLFYVMDEGSRASIQLPPKWRLVARDAFNGTILWKRSIALWYTHLYPLKSGPAFLARRLVAVGDRVYVTLGLDQPLVALDAATGETILTYEESEATEEVIACDGTLFLLVNSTPLKPDRYTWNDPVCWNEKARVAKERPWDQVPRTILAVEAEAADVLWSHESVVAPLSLASDGRRVVFHDGEKVVCLDRRSGKPRWSSAPIRMRKPLPTCYAPTLVMYDDVVLFAGGDRRMTAVSAETGKSLWTKPHYRAGHNSPEDVLVIDGLAWTGKIAGGRDSGVWTGYDVKTGRVAREFTPDVETYWFHHRCYRSKATVNYLLPSRTGLEFVDWRKEIWTPHHWVRGACVYGIMPCNGLVYGYGRKPMYYVWSPALEYRLFASEKEISPEAIARVARAEEKIRNADSRWFFNREVTRPLSIKDLSTASVRWCRDEPQLMARAMVLADKTLFVAGPPDVLDEEAAVARRFDDDVQKQLEAQDAALAGKKGALLWAVSASRGERIAELKLDSTPVWDGMAAASGQLFLATTDGKVRCFTGR